jgi:anti-sigma B factor antagonist
MPHISVPAAEPCAATWAPRFAGSCDGAENACCVTVAGELDIATVPQLDRALRRAQADGSPVVVDLRELGFTDSSGAHLILATNRRVRLAGGRLLVVRGPAQVQRLFALMGVDRELEFVDQPPYGSYVDRQQLGHGS